MRKYEITPQQRAFYEGLQVPFAACRILDRQLVPLTVSAGFHALFGDAEPCVFGDVLRDDVNIVEDALQRFASGDERCRRRADVWCSYGTQTRGRRRIGTPITPTAAMIT